LLRRKVSLYWKKEDKEEEVVAILEEIESLTQYENLKKDVEELLLTKYRKNNKYDKMINIYNKRLNRAKSKGNKKDINDYKKRLKDINQLKKRNKK